MHRTSHNRPTWFDYLAAVALLCSLYAVWASSPADSTSFWVRPVHAAENSGLAPRSLQWEVAAPGANTDAIDDITWKSVYPLRIAIQCDTSTVVNVMVNRGGTENAIGLNSNDALPAGAGHVFDVFGLTKDDVVNVQVETDSALPLVAIYEVR